MRRRALILFLLCTVLATASFADTLKLTNGKVINGIFVGRSGGGVEFIGPDGLTNTYPSNEVAGVTFGPVTPPKPKPAPHRVSVPAGTLILVRTNEQLDTDNSYTGQVFSVTLMTDLAADGYVVAKSGTRLYGNIVEADSARRASGTSQLKLQLTQIVLHGQAIPIVTDVFDSKGKSSGKRSARRLFGGAGLGAAIGAIAGNAGMGAAIGAVSGAALSVVQKGDQVQIPAEAQLSFTLQVPVTLPVAQ